MAPRNVVAALACVVLTLAGCADDSNQSPASPPRLTTQQLGEVVVSAAPTSMEAQTFAVDRDAASPDVWDSSTHWWNLGQPSHGDASIEISPERCRHFLQVMPVWSSMQDVAPASSVFESVSAANGARVGDGEDLNSYFEVVYLTGGESEARAFVAAFEDVESCSLLSVSEGSDIQEMTLQKVDSPQLGDATASFQAEIPGDVDVLQTLTTKGPYVISLTRSTSASLSAAQIYRSTLEGLALS